jgi:hypothetical protein
MEPTYPILRNPAQSRAAGSTCAPQPFSETAMRSAGTPSRMYSRASDARRGDGEIDRVEDMSHVGQSSTDISRLD